MCPTVDFLFWEFRCRLLYEVFRDKCVLFYLTDMKSHVLQLSGDGIQEELITYILIRHFETLTSVVSFGLQMESSLKTDV